MVDQLLESGNGSLHRPVKLNIRFDLFEGSRRIFPAAQDLEILVFGRLSLGQAAKREFPGEIIESHFGGFIPAGVAIDENFIGPGRGLHRS